MRRYKSVWAHLAWFAVNVASTVHSAIHRQVGWTLVSSFVAGMLLMGALYQYIAARWPR